MNPDIAMFKLEFLISCLPENRPIYKDSGLWQIRTDDMEDVIYQQKPNETFKEFIVNYLSVVIEEAKINFSIVNNNLLDLMSGGVEIRNIESTK